MPVEGVAVGVVAARGRVEHEHRLGRVVASDARELGLRRARRTPPAEPLERDARDVEHPDRHPTVAWLAPGQREQRLALLARRDRVPRTTDGQYPVAPRGIDEAAGEVVAEVVVADRLAGGQRAVPEQQEGLAAAHPLDLSRERLEVRRRAHDRVGRARVDQRALEGELGVLEREARLLHADRREQHEVLDAGRLRRLEQGHVRAVIDRPGVLRHARARGEAGDDGVEALAAERVALDRRRIGDVDGTELDVGRQAGGTSHGVDLVGRPVGANETDHVVTGTAQRPHGRPPGRAGRARHEDAKGGGRRGAVAPPAVR